MEEEEENRSINANDTARTAEEEEDLSENQKEELPLEQRIPIEIFRRESIDGKLDSKIGVFLAIGAIKNMDIGIPPCCNVKDILFMVDEHKNEDKYLTEETFITLFAECLKIIKTEFMLVEEEEDDSESFELTKDFIQDRLSDLQQVEDSDFCFTFTSFCVQAADISNLSLLLEYDSLTNISLKNNDISDFSILGKMPRLKNLDLTENRIKSTRIVSFPVLEKLNLSKNSITYIEAYNMPKLKELNFSENKVFFIAPSAFVNCPSLESLDFSINNLQDIREGAFNGLNQLKKLKLNSNSLVSVLHAFSKDLINLSILDLSENPLESTEGIQFLNNLENCDLHKTPIENLASFSYISNLSNLKNLSIYDSPLGDVEDIRLEIIHLLPSLEVIDDETVTINERQDSKALFEQRAEEERRLLEEKLAEEAASRAEAEAAARAAALAAEEEDMEQNAETEDAVSSEMIYNETEESAKTV